MKQNLKNKLLILNVPLENCQKIKLNHPIKDLFYGYLQKNLDHYKLITNTVDKKFCVFLSSRFISIPFSCKEFAKMHHVELGLLCIFNNVKKRVENPNTEQTRKAREDQQFQLITGQETYTILTMLSTKGKYHVQHCTVCSVCKKLTDIGKVVQTFAITMESTFHQIE